MLLQTFHRRREESTDSCSGNAREESKGGCRRRIQDAVPAKVEIDCCSPTCSHISAHEDWQVSEKCLRGADQTTDLCVL